MDTREQARSYASADFAGANKLFLDMLQKRIKVTAQTKLLDIGCGDGEILIQIHKLLQCNITALDGSKCMLDELNQKLKIHNMNEVKVVNEKLETNSLMNKSFDLVISNSVLHHVKSPSLFWEKLIDLTKPGGFIAVMDLFRPDTESSLAQTLKTYGGEDPVLLKDFENSLRAAYTIDEVQEQLQKSRASSYIVKPISDRHFFVTIEK